MNKNAKIILLFISIILLILPIFVFIKFYKKQEQNNLSIEEVNETIKIEEEKSYVSKFAEKNNVAEDMVVEHKINDIYTNLYLKDDDKTSIIVNYKNNTEVSINEFIKEEKINDFNALISNQINIKYPLFIAKELIKEQTKKNYVFSNNGIKVYFSNYTTTPYYEKETYISLTCQMLQDFNFKNCTEKTDENPNKQNLDPNKPIVALTFDDGPNNNTRRVVQILKDNNAKATFFMLGQNMRYYPNIVKEVALTNNEIASHTYSHKFLTKLSDEELQYEITQPNEILYNLTGKEIKLVRPPYGSINKNVKSTINTPIILWSIDPEDWRYKNTQKITEKVLSNVDDGDIILLHDIHSTTADALEVILPELYIREIQVTTISEISKIKNIILENSTIYRNFK